MNPADSDTQYAYWTDPGNRCSVTYSLGVFHEIDFEVSEGFRRIPHGGIETGGLLFGRADDNSGQISIQIEAFRAIESEHASGPSFNLSERDVAAVRDQIAAAASDPELQGLEVLGWFVAHTRSPLQMNDRETVLFGQLFPGPGRVLLLIKPERFQATRFAFFWRDGNGRVDPEGAANAIILPLPGRAGHSTQGPAASIPAPVQSVAPTAPAAQTAPFVPAVAPPPVPPPPVPPPTPAPAPVAPTPYVAPPDAAAPSFWRDVPAQPPQQEPVVWIQEPRIQEPRIPEPRIDQPPAGPLQEQASAVVPSAAPSDALPSIAEIKRRRSENLQAPGADGSRSGKPRITQKMSRGGRPSPLRLILLLLLAGGLGCAVGYFAYLQLPSATIEMTVRREPAPTAVSGKLGAAVSSLIVSWPPEQTRDAIFASIRVDDGEATPLSTEQKTAGRALLPVRSDNVKIELIAQRRWRDSRGIVRYVRGSSTPRAAS